MVVKHVSMEELQAIPAAADDLFIIGGKDALVKKQQVQHINIDFLYCYFLCYCAMWQVQLVKFEESVYFYGSFCTVGTHLF